ncbi:MAG: sugar ABC transporter permease [Tyzzerella sp.]|nr:sugar ABC transporter permease [Tyzzerella sp.]
MKKRKKVSSFKRREHLTGLLFIAPMYLQFLVFTLFFLGYSLYMSFTDWNIVAGTKNFIAFENFVQILKDPIFWKSVWNTVYLMIGIPIGMFLALLMAMALNRKLPGKTIFRVSVYLPAVTSAMAIVILWRFIYNAEYGVINLVIQQLTGEAGPNWLGDPAMVKISLIIMGVWRGVGNTMILFLAGLQNVPRDYYEVVDVEGGNSLHKFRYVTLPMLSSVTFYVLITGVIGGLQAFGDQFIMTGAGPEHSAITIVYYLWQKGFAEYDMGGASAVSWIVAVMIFVVTLIQFKLSNRWVYED